jgi:sulfatase modifying factor 1
MSSQHRTSPREASKIAVMLVERGMRLGVLAFAGLTIDVGCSSSTKSTVNAASCKSDEFVLCTTESGCRGEKRCKPDGSGFGDCVCLDGGAGSGGTPGTDAGGGSGGSVPGGTGGSTGGTTSDGGSGTAGAAGMEPSSGPPSCVGLATSCGPAGTGDCCESIPIPAGTFTLGRAPTDPDNEPCTTISCGSDELPVSASVSAFRLDRYEVTVGRFRKFVAAGAPRPAAGSGKHVHLSGGGIVNETGWQDSWPLASDYDSALACHEEATWTPTPGPNENRPVTCITWYEAYAFCIWDGGFLPTEAEWEYVASGGQERFYPWSVPANSTSVGSTHACWAGCAGPRDVGQFIEGAARWGHMDLAGNVWEWMLDWYKPEYASPCVDCANLTASTARVLRGAGYTDPASWLRAAQRASFLGRSWDDGVRCARPMP